MIVAFSNMFADDFEKKENSEYFSEQEESNAYDFAPVIGEFKYNPEYAKMVREKEELADRYYQAKISGNIELATKLLSEFHEIGMKSTDNPKDNLNVRASYKYLDVWQVPQSTNYYCGYASIKSILDYHRVNKTQDEIAEEVYSINDSCPWYLMNGNSYDQFPVPKYLKEKTGFNYAPYPYGAAGSANISISDVRRRVVSTLDDEQGLMACGSSKGSESEHESILPGYPSYDVNHWIVVRGYKKYGDTIFIADPAKSSAVSFSDNIRAYYSVSASKLRAFIQPRGLVW